MNANADFTSIVGQCPDPVIVLSLEHPVIEWMNDAAQDWLQRSRETCIGQSVLRLLSQQSAGTLHLESTDEHLQCVRGEGLELTRRNGEVMVSNYLVYTIENARVLMLCQPPLSSSAALNDGDGQALTSLGRMLAHELKNPLAGISGAAQLLKLEQNNDDSRAMTDMIISEVDRLSRLVNQIETFGASSAIDHVPINIHSVLRKTQTVFQNQPGHSVVFSETYDPSLPDILGDMDQLSQVFTNLIANALDAIRASGQGDRITLQTAYQSGVVKRSKDGERAEVPVLIKVVDNGPGIDEDIRDRIFEPFVTTKTNGQGLGLALVSKIVNNHDGLIEVKSRPGRTEIIVRFPANIEAPS